jgi:predicted Zn-dependent protease with MMP-like domain
MATRPDDDGAGDPAPAAAPAPPAGTPGPGTPGPGTPGPGTPGPGTPGPGLPNAGLPGPGLSGSVAPVPLRKPHSRRDRHGRGLRGPLIPVSLPASRTRGDTFDEYVLDAAARLRSRLPERVEHVQFSVEDIPPPGVTDALVPGEGVPLGSGIPADADNPARVVVYRRTLELRAGAGAEAAELVYDVLLEQVADLLGILPEDIDPEYGEEAG